MPEVTPENADESWPAELDREHVIAALQARERFLTAILGSLESFFTVDSKWHCTFANEAGADLAGVVAAGELLGADLRDYIPAEVRDEVCARLHVAMSERVRSAVEAGDPVRRIFAAYPLADGGLAIYVRDVSALDRSEAERRRADEALREHEERFRSLFASMTEGVALHQLVYEGGEAVDYVVVDVNPAFERHTAMSAESVQGRRASEAYGTGEAPYLAEYAKVAESGEPCTFETYFEPLQRHFRITAVALEGARFATVFDDITERKRAAETLRESEERFRLLHDTMLQGVVYQDADGTIVSMNPAAERILGKRPEDFLGSSSVGEEHDTLREDGTSFPGLEHPAMVAVRTGRPVPDVLMQVYNPREAQYRLISVQAVPLFHTGEERPYRVYTVFDDVTERRRAEEVQRELEAVKIAQAERSRVARDLHDSVTQALFAATMKAEALTLADDSLSEETSQLAEGVRRLSRGALAQMRTLLLELRGDALEDVPISQLLRQLVEAAESRASVNVQLTIRGDVQLSPTLHAPVYRIAQEALNNVTRHAGASKAWVDLDVEPDGVRLVVGDDGCGFEPSACDPTHIGLNSMRERAAEAGAQFGIVTKLGGGTLITVGWPRD